MSKSKILEQANVLRKWWGGYWPARVLLTANNLGVFHLLKHPRTAREVAGEIKSDKRATGILLDALTGMELLEKDGDRYRNTAVSNLLLTPESPYYQGDILRHGDYLWKSWSGLDKVIRTGKPNSVVFDTGSYIRGMHNLSVLKADRILRFISLRGVKTALDLGGGPGTYSIEMARRGIRVTLFDRPEVIPIAKDIARKARVKGIRFIQGDLLADSIGKGYDLVFISHVLHVFPERRNIETIEKAERALNPGGRVAIQEFLLHEDRTRPLSAAIFSVNMLVNTDSGRSYTAGEIKSWLEQAGLSRIRSRSFDDTLLIQGAKA